ncbi:MAG: AAA family ATPase, partial [Candidatus Izemoplasmatales bacterium]|nr:AAA family ATPase [Candidatus Izemoplasmatales bacterium]
MKRLKIFMILILVFGVLAIAGIASNPNFFDRSLVIGSAQIIFIILAAILLLVFFIVIVRSLYKERKRLQMNLEAEPTPQPTPEVSSETESTPEEYDFHITMEKQEETPEEEDDRSRFFKLNQIDQLPKTEKAFEDDITLEELCEEFRNFAASQRGLFYDISDIRRFVGGLAVSHIMILQGMSGTGKTSLAYAFGDYIQNSTVVVPIQPMWKERTDLIGYYNEFTKKFNETTLLEKMYEANQSEQMYITVLDEMNIARVEYYFAEFLSLLELPDPSKRHLDVIADVWETDPTQLSNGKLILPTNMWFVGTAN